jgi:hypothetical protein
MIVHLKKGLPSPPRDWSQCQEPYTPEDDALPPGVGSERPPYGISEDVQRALAGLRTDLDAFSDDEAYALMAAGYAMTRVELARAMPDLPPPDPELERAVDWPFAATLARLDEGANGLAESLEPGRARFFRGLLARRLRRAGRPKGRLRRVFEKTGLPSAPGVLVRAVGAGALAPVRWVASAPLAAVGAIAARLRR